MNVLRMLWEHLLASGISHECLFFSPDSNYGAGSIALLAKPKPKYQSVQCDGSLYFLAGTTVLKLKFDVSGPPIYVDIAKPGQDLMEIIERLVAFYRPV